MPRTPRALAPWVGQPGAESAIYHCVSRVVNRDLVLQRAEKEEFVRLMRLYEQFCGVRILTFCVMSNHFHLLVEVPPRPQDGLSDEELCQRLRLLKGEAEVEEFRALLERCRQMGDAQGAEALREKHLYRMWDLGQFMKSLKQCFTRWFNRRHGRYGTLWEERYKSVLVEDGVAARVIGAYIDLNPVRAGMVSTPERYRWCGYSAALAGGGAARVGIERMMDEYEKMAGGRRPKRPWRSVIRAYRVILFSDGEVCYRENETTGKIELVRRGISGDEVEEVRAKDGKMSLSEMLECRVRAFTEGMVLGSSRFTERFFAAKRGLFGPKRKTGARTIPGCETELHCVRLPRQDALG